MMSKFFNADFKTIYPDPTPERLAEAFFNRIYRKLHVDNFSFLIVFYGRHRTGKSMAATSFSNIIDPTFGANLEERVVYSSRALINAFKQIRQQKIKGAAVIVDEAGSGDMSSQRWFEETSKLVSANLQAVGYLNPCISFVTQHFGFINSTVRRLSQGIFECERTNNQFCSIKPYWISNNPWSTTMYRKYPLFVENRNGIASSIYKVNQIKIGLPPEPLRSRYIAHSQAYKDNLLIESEKQIESTEFSQTMKTSYQANIQTIVDEVMNDIESYIGYGTGNAKNKISQNIIRVKHQVSQADAKTIRLMAQKKLDEQETENQKIDETDNDDSA